MPIQIDYQDRLDRGRAGHIHNTELCNLFSRGVEDAAGIGFGVPVTRGTNERSITAIDSGDPVLGITCRDRSAVGTLANGFAQYEESQVSDFGYVDVAVTEAVNAGDPAFFSIADQAWGNAGAIQYGIYDTSTTGAGTASIRIR